jgi:conjugative transfer signal peptidase TraF
MKPYLILSVAILAIGALMKRPGARPQYILNLSRSAPVGFYRLEAAPLHRGAFAVVLLGQPWRSLARSRGYLLSKAWLIKPVAALGGDRICRLGRMITINGRFATVAQPADKRGRALPQWQGCKTLIDGEMFLLSDKKGSFDGRYFGVTPHAALIARAVPVLEPLGD